MKKLLAAGRMLVAVALGVVAGAHGAAAADLSLAPLYKAPPAEIAPVYNWTGFYLGANGGGGWGHSFWNANTTGINLSGGQAGGTLGYNRQLGNVVFGLEGDVDWSGFNGTNTTVGCPGGCSTSDSWLSTVRGRIGYSFDRVMPYATGGLAVGDIRASTPGFAGASQTNAGWTVGGGLEFALTNNWTAKAEYLHVDLGNLNCGFSCGVASGNNVSVRSDVVRGGLNFRFGN